jgi:hypothetical protein
MVKKSFIDVDEETWKEVQKYKIDKSYKKVNEAVIDLIKEGLKIYEKKK